MEEIADGLEWREVLEIHVEKVVERDVNAEDSANSEESADHKLIEADVRQNGLDGF